MHRLSIVIPCRAFNQSAEDTLVSVLQNRPSACEVIVVTAGKYDDPYDLEGEVKFIEEDETAGITRLINCGFKTATAEVVHVLMPGVQALDEWTDAVLDHFEDPEVGAVSPALVTRASDSRALSLGVSYWACGARRLVGKRAKLRNARTAETAVLGPCLEASYYRRSVITSLGGFDERMDTDVADVEMGLALRQLGFRSIVEPSSLLVRGNVEFRTSAFQRARQAERLFRRYSTSGAGIAFLHAVVAAADSIRALPRPQAVTKLIGRVAAWFESGVQERQQERVHRAQACLARRTVGQSVPSIRGEFTQSRAKPLGTTERARHRAA